MVLVDPDAELKAELVIEEAQRLVVEGDPRAYLWVKAGNRTAIDRVELVVTGAGTELHVPVEALASRVACGERSTCFGLSLAPGLPEDARTLVLSVPSLGHQHVRPIAEHRLAPHRITVEARSANTRVRAVIDDPIAAHLAALEAERPLEGLPRRFERSFEAHTAAGGCASPAAPDDPSWVRVPSGRFELDAPFSTGEAPLSCLSVRPSEPVGGAAVLEVSVPARALVTTFDHVYSPPVEIAPLVFLPLFDLQIASPERCAEAEQLITGAIAAAAQEIAGAQETPAEVLQLEPVEIASDGGAPCQQANERSFDAEAIAARVHGALDAAFGAERRVRVVFVYANNLDLPPPRGVVTALELLRERFDLSTSERRGSSLFAIVPERAAPALSADVVLPFSATAEPAFRSSIVSTLRGALWPFRTVLHTFDTEVPLIEEALRDRFALFRVCSGSLPIAPVGAPRDRAIVPQRGVPSYQVDLPQQVLVPGPGFVAPVVTVRWQGCEALCDHAGPGAAPQSSWVRDGGCS